MMERAETILGRTGLLVSKHKLKQIEGIELVRLKREQRTQDLCFSSRPFVLCGLPVRRLPKGHRNGRFLLQITGHPNFGGPFGQDRLVPIFLPTLDAATDALARRSVRSCFPTAPAQVRCLVQ
jgi:hypothetical protein